MRFPVHSTKLSAPAHAFPADLQAYGAWLSDEASSGRLFEPPPAGAATPVGFADVL